MVNRRSVLSIVLLAAGGASAQDAPPPRRPATRRSARDDQNGAYMGGGMVVQETPFNGPRVQRQEIERAPVPNTALEAPRQQHADAARLTPGVIAPQLPGRGSAQETGSPGSLQDRLFRPAPGAHLRIPLTW